METVNQDNLNYLKEQVFYTGFGSMLDAPLIEQLQKQPKEFSLHFQTQFGNDKVQAQLQFSKSNQPDSNYYFFNDYKIAVAQEGKPTMQQQFQVYPHNTITLKEAYNLMQGRAVHKNLKSKEGNDYQAWVQLDFKQHDKYGNYQQQKYHEGYGFDLEKTLAGYPIKELENEQLKTQLQERLKKGNPAPATLLENGKEEPIYIVANPRFKSVILYNEQMQRLGQGNTKKQEQRTTKKVAQKEGEDQSPSPSKRKRKGKAV
ncbi:hypothetical protein ACG2LH_15325 [Zhouia sp. PK063]|uniref:hypothetical protein n=1 Tax=Zhouia sp. PK063 TaxID=3373602 RepID=UPI003787F38F